MPTLRGVVILLAMTALAAPGSALARTDVSYSPSSGLLITASTQAPLTLHIRNDEGVLEWQLSQSGLDVSMVAGLGCRQAGPFDARCHPTGSQAVNATLSNDNSVAGEALHLDETRSFDFVPMFTSSVTADGRGGRDELDGSRGPDTLRGGDGVDLLEPNLGNDVAEGGAGDDALFASNFLTIGNAEANGLNGADVYKGGPGTDVVAYIGRRVPIVASLDGQANDGEAGENDNAGPDNDVEDLAGGSNRNTLTGNDGANRLAGGGDDDTLRGLGGNDVLRGGVFGNDNLDGGPGDDVLTGNAGVDRFTGGPGGDSIMARDGIRDHTIGCSGRDVVEIDLKDTFPTGTCLSVSSFPVDERAVEILTQRPRLRRGAIRLRMRCPKRNKRACAGKLRVRRPGGRSSRAAAYRIKRGRSKAVTVALRAKDAARLESRGGGTVVATSVERVKLGNETVIRRISVRA